jgi:hypothetical protein
MTPRRALVMRAFASAYLEALPPVERIAFLTEQLLAITDENSAADLTFAAIEINEHADALHWSWFASRQLGHPPLFPNQGVSP